MQRYNGLDAKRYFQNILKTEKFVRFLQKRNELLSKICINKQTVTVFKVASNNAPNAKLDVDEIAIILYTIM